MELDINLAVEILRRMYTIRSKLSLSYIVYILLFILFVGVISNYIIKNEFKEYSKKKLENQITQITRQINNQYNDGWNVDNIKVIGSNALENGLIISVYGTNNKTIWDAFVHNGHQCSMVIDGIATMMIEHDPNWKGKFVVKEFPLTQSNANIGSIHIGYLSPYFYTETEFAFLSTLNTLYIIASIIFVSMALVLGAYIAKRLAMPLNKVVKATTNLSQGIYEKIPSDETNIIEINKLTNSINSLSTTLANQEALRKQLTSDVTHELRTPLSTLQAHFEAMLDGVIEVDQKQLNSLHDEIIRLNKIVSDLDNSTLIDQNNLTLNKQTINISDLIEKAINIFKIQFSSENKTLNFDRENILIYVDKDKIYQVLINLISNALKHTKENDLVKITVINEKEQIKIVVKDTGTGISVTDLPHIFERFYRADKSRNRKTGGTGIGLSIVKSIVLAHNGKIIAESKIGEGTQITVSLPK